MILKLYYVTIHLYPLGMHFTCLLSSFTNVYCQGE